MSGRDPNHDAPRLFGGVTGGVAGGPPEPPDHAPPSALRRIGIFPPSLPQTRQQNDRRYDDCAGDEQLLLICDCKYSCL